MKKLFVTALLLSSLSISANWLDDMQPSEIKNTLLQIRSAHSGSSSGVSFPSKEEIAAHKRKMRLRELKRLSFIAQSCELEQRPTTLTNLQYDMDIMQEEIDSMNVDIRRIMKETRNSDWAHFVDKLYELVGKGAWDMVRDRQDIEEELEFYQSLETEWLELFQKECVQ